MPSTAGFGKLVEVMEAFMLGVCRAARATMVLKLSMAEVCERAAAHQLVRIRQFIKDQRWGGAGQVSKVMHKVHLVVVPKLGRNVAPRSERLLSLHSQSGFEPSHPPKPLRRNAKLFLKQPLNLSRLNGRIVQPLVQRLARIGCFRGDLNPSREVTPLCIRGRHKGKQSLFGNRDSLREGTASANSLTQTRQAYGFEVHRFPREFVHRQPKEPMECRRAKNDGEVSEPARSIQANRRHGLEPNK
jgi:hypothetical protein